MGKRQIGELEPFELVIALIIADLAAIPMSEQTMPLWYGVFPLLIIAILHYLITTVTKVCPTLRDVVSGRPVVVVDPNGIVVEELNKLNISCEELVEQLRNLEYFDIADINYAIIERNGKITIIPKTNSVPVTRKDMKIVKPENDIFYCVVENGKVLSHNIKEMGLNKKELMPLILDNTKSTVKEIEFCNLSEGGDLHVQKKNDIMKNFKLKFGEKHYLKSELESMKELGERVG